MCRCHVSVHWLVLGVRGDTDGQDGVRAAAALQHAREYTRVLVVGGGERLNVKLILIHLSSLPTLICIWSHIISSKNQMKMRA